MPGATNAASNRPRSWLCGPGGGYGGDNDRYLDLRVDDAVEPVQQLVELVKMHHLYFQPARPEDIIWIDSDIASELQAIMITQGYMTGEVNGDGTKSVSRSSSC